MGLNEIETGSDERTSVTSSAASNRIWLSAPHMSGAELALVQEAFASNWISSVGPQLSAFEQELETTLGAPVVALASGTAALHLGLRLLDVGPGDDVLCPTLTFAASCNPVVYQGARPVFLDAERRSFNLDPDILRDTLRERARKNRLPKAVVVVHLFGQSADLEPILGECARYEVPVLEDAAEAMGTHYHGRHVGAMTDVGVVSFNGNKIITTSGGGALVCRRREWVDKARFWSTQARDPGISYEHSELGFNYRMSNILAAIGLGQLRVLEERVQARRAIAERYREAFADLPGIEPMPEAPWGRHTRWLSVFLLDPAQVRAGRDELVRVLAAEEIEARPIWKPMHLQVLYRDAERVGGAVAEDLFARGICLPSSSNLAPAQQARVIDCVRRALGAPRSEPRA